MKSSNKDPLFTQLFTGQSKPSVSSAGDDTFVTPRKSRKSKKPVITFSSDEEEDEEGEWHYPAAANFPRDALTALLSLNGFAHNMSNTPQNYLETVVPHIWAVWYL